MDIKEKSCGKCGRLLPLDAFNKDNRRGDGRCRWCRECQKEYQAAYYESNRDSILKQHRTRRAENLEEMLERERGYHRKYRERELQYNKRWQAANPERRKAHNANYYRKHKHRVLAKVKGWQKANWKRVLGYKRKWTDNNPLKTREIKHRRRAREHATRIGPINYKAIWEMSGGICHICGEQIERSELSFDHVIPLAKGGAHTQGNIKVAHNTCNKRKGTKELL